MGWIKRRRASDDALAKSRELLTNAADLPVGSPALRDVIDLSDAWLRHANAACAPPR